VHPNRIGTAKHDRKPILQGSTVRDDQQRGTQSMASELRCSIGNMGRWFVSVSRPDLLSWREAAPVPSYEIEADDASAAAAAAVSRWKREQRTTDEPGYVSVQPFDERFRGT
jgi:hypothetical protein